ncbi:uncharacterized protein BJ212DRAFT_1301749 [Suillus subaureus]|uniref:Uncharacterized protein n=1 Tax=Suillus subaureus TaxID=48587 RepID=A0A9P7E6N5_9AGAM|nr:uncharacterized protein BJ212DRAFT_1301749 [Suillus subaureus]KAG1812250.1 hypothetical protein BJ212DRAFT_1301749 [Suillus subaureus]
MLSPTPAALQSVLNSCTSVVFSVADLSKVKSAALFQMKCTIFINTFFLDAATIRKMAHQCMDAEVSHDKKPKKELFLHDRKYINYIGQDQDIQHLLNFIGVLFKWALSELSTGKFKDQDFKMNKKTHEYPKELKKLFDAMPIEHHNALVRSIFTQEGQ